MSDLNIRNFSKELLHDIKVEAASRGISLRDLVTEWLRYAHENSDLRQIAADRKNGVDSVRLISPPRAHHPQCPCTACKPPVKKSK